MEKYIPYGIDLDFQYKTYKNIGESYRIEFKARKNLLYRVRKCIREFRNKNEKNIRILIRFHSGKTVLGENLKTLLIWEIFYLI